MLVRMLRKFMVHAIMFIRRVLLTKYNVFPLLSSSAICVALFIWCVKFDRINNSFMLDVEPT